jgi:hypothetical protein
MLEIYELLDRFELLYPYNTKLSDLRRSYIDRDLTSIFRLLPNTVSGDIDDLRKAVLEKNLHSIFRLVDDEDLRKLVIEDNVWKLWPILERYVDTQFVAAFKNFFVNNIKIDPDCFSRGQLQSKLWLVEQLKKCDVDLGTVFLCAGWYGTLAVMLFESGIKVEKIRSFDIDTTTVDIAETFNKPWFTDQWCYKALINNIHDIDYKEHTWQYWSNTNNRMSYPITDTPNTIINTSCEHIENYAEWYNKIPLGKLVVLQGNNYFEILEHVNCSSNLQEFSNKSPMTKTLYEGELELPKYKRFMKIGFR